MTAFTIAPSSERALDLGAYLLGTLELALILGALAYAGWRVRRTVLPGWSGAPARLAESVLALAALIWLAQVLGTFGAYTELAMLLCCAGARGALRPRLRPPRSARAAGAAAAPPAPAASRVAIWLAAGDLRRGRRRLDGADPRQPRRRHGPRRHALVPHAARRPLRGDRRAGVDRLLRPDLLRLLLPGELRGPALGRAARLRARHPLAAAQPRLPRRSGCSPPTASAAPTASGRRA